MFQRTRQSTYMLPERILSEIGCTDAQRVYVLTFERLSRAPARGVIGCSFDEALEHPEVTLVHEVMGPRSPSTATTRPPIISTPIVSSTARPRASKTLMSVVRRYAIGLCTTRTPSLPNVRRSVLAHPLEGIG